jgi:8-amino-7-oxononanoate synthase
MDEPTPTPLELKLAHLLARRRANSTLRTLTVNHPRQTDFSSNDFLSLASNKDLKKAYLQELEKEDLPIGSGGSRLLDGNSTYAEDLERDVARFHGARAGLLFNSGFDANAGFFACVPQPGDVILYDALIHASVHDGMRLSRASSTIPFAHNCIIDLRAKLTAFLSQDLGARLRSGEAHVFVAVEAVYSMDGDIAPLQGIVEAVEEVLPKGCGYVVLDEAHATGVLGPQGRGLVCALGLEQRVFARLHTFGKAVGCNGGTSSPYLFPLLQTLSSRIYRKTIVQLA